VSHYGCTPDGYVIRAAILAPIPEGATEWTPADPAAYAQLRAEIQAQLTAQRHADAERHSEARAAVQTIHMHAECCGTMLATGTHDRTRWADFALMTRQDRWADYAGQPATLPSAYTPEA
jgi:hypothetical protein